MARQGSSIPSAVQVEFQGTNFIRYPESKCKSDQVYFKGWWHGTKTYLHRAIYESIHGPIPAGYEVHHRDENTEHNQIDGSNYELLPCSTHRKHHAPRTGRAGREGKTFRMPCVQCGQAITAKSKKRQFCSPMCQYYAAQGRQAA